MRRSGAVCYFEEKERRADVVQHMEEFCSAETVHRKPVGWNGELQQETQISHFTLT